MADNTKNNGAKKAGSGPSDEMKRRFREALDKKQSHGGKDVSDHSEHGKVDSAHDAQTSGAQQMFRRKSGS